MAWKIDAKHCRSANVGTLREVLGGQPPQPGRESHRDLHVIDGVGGADFAGNDAAAPHLAEKIETGLGIVDVAVQVHAGAAYVV
jgi:hypothetical protein